MIDWVGRIRRIWSRLTHVYNIVLSMLRLTETGGTLTANGTEQNVYINNNPMGIYEPRKVKIDMSNMDWGDTIIIRWYERLNNGGGLVLKDEFQFEDVQESQIKNIELEPNRFGVQVTLEQIAGTYRNFDYETFMEY